MLSRRTLIVVTILVFVVIGSIVYMEQGMNTPPTRKKGSAASTSSVEFHWVCNPVKNVCRKRFTATEKNIAKGEIDYFPASGIDTKEKCQTACAQVASTRSSSSGSSVSKKAKK